MALTPTRLDWARRTRGSPLAPSTTSEPREPHDHEPILIGFGESSGRTSSLPWPSPLDLSRLAIEAALRDTGRAEPVRAAIDCVVGIRSFHDSGLRHEFGAPENLPEAIAAEAHICPRTLVYAEIGGHSPQRLIHEFADRLVHSEQTAVLLSGAEAIGCLKRARRAGRVLDWSRPGSRDVDDRKTDSPILSQAEIRHGIRSMILAYSLIEQARRVRFSELDPFSAVDDTAARLVSAEQQLDHMAQLGAAFAEVARSREHAQFARAWTPAELRSESASNYRVSDAYLRWSVAQDAVDLGAAVILTTVGTARRLEVPPDRWIFLAAGADADAPPLSERADWIDRAGHRSATGVARSWELCWSVRAALEAAELDANSLGPIDLYSCFPCVVDMGIEALGTTNRALGEYTCTGGLSFFGGPGNGYSLHGLVALGQRLRGEPERPGLLLANGGVLSKLSVGIYAGQPPKQPWRTARRAGSTQRALETRTLRLRSPEPEEAATIESHARAVSRLDSTASAEAATRGDAPNAGPITALVRFADGDRGIVLLTPTGSSEELLLRRVRCSTEGPRAHAKLEG